jgi:aspartokinase-like uncharacterized kinase
MELSVLKVGGSLAEKPEKLRQLCQSISEFAAVHKLVVVGGGGEFADTVRDFDKRFFLTDETAHRMAILAMDQYGLLLADLIPKAVTVDSYERAREVLNERKVPVFLPSKIMFQANPLENSWAVTSDSVALYLAGQIHAEKVVLVTDVDGVFTADPKIQPDAALLENLTADELAQMGRTSIDSYLPRLLSQTPIDCIVLNGLYPKRLKDALESKKARYTKISGKQS